MTQSKKVIHFILMASTTILLSGCFGKDMTDLRNYIKKIKERPPKAIAPLPKIKQVETFVYEDQGRRDPFNAAFGEENIENGNITGDGLQPDHARRKEELERYPLDSLRMVGTLKQTDKTWGLIQTQDGVIHRVEPGNHAGLNHGQITHISEEKIELTEIVAVGDGNYRERQAVISLSDLQARKGR